jgi:hypothetical protein
MAFGLFAFFTMAIAMNEGQTFENHFQECPQQADNIGLKIDIQMLSHFS